MITAQRKDAATVRREIDTLTDPSKRMCDVPLCYPCRPLIVLIPTRKGTLVIIDSLYPVIHETGSSLSSMTLQTFLAAVLGVSSRSLLAIHHTDIPLPLPVPPNYNPSPFVLLRYLATTIFTCHSFTQTLARKYAVDRSQPEPLFGLAEEKEGVISGLPELRDGRNSEFEHIEGKRKGAGSGGAGLVLQAEFRRKSGRAIEEWYFIPDMSTTKTPTAKKGDDKVILLDDHPDYNRHDTGAGGGIGHPDGPNLPEGAASLGASDQSTSSSSTFELGLTERQKKDREGVVLPYFDAQKGVLGEGGEGGRILYDLGVEDDFDEEEDEI